MGYAAKAAQYGAVGSPSLKTSSERVACVRDGREAACFKKAVSALVSAKQDERGRTVGVAARAEGRAAVVRVCAVAAAV